MSTDPASLLGDTEGEIWSSFVLPDDSIPAVPGINSNASPSANLTTPSPGSSSTVGEKTKGTRVANLLTLTELRKATWARIYASGLGTGNAAITTSRVPTWKQFDALMIKRHRFIAVDPRDNRTLGWIACFHPYPQLEVFYSEDDATSDVGMSDDKDGRQGRVAEMQVMVAQAERGRGVGTFLVKAILASLKTDQRYSTVQASFFPENEACQKLFERCEFQTVTTRSRAVRMVDGPRKDDWRDLVTVECKLPPIPLAQQQQRLSPKYQQEPSPPTTPAMNMTVDPNALFKRPRLD